MNDKIKLIVFGVVGLIGSFAVFLAIFWLIFSMRAPAQPAQAEVPAGGQAAAAEIARISARRDTTVPGGEVMAYADVLGENIPLEPQVNGYHWAVWGMNLEQVLSGLKQEGVQEIQTYSPEGKNFTCLVALNPDNLRYKVEYRFYANELFHVEIFYSDFYRTTAFNAFLLDRMREYGRPYEQYATVDELGNVILHAKWDTEQTLVELVAHPNGRYSLFLDRQLTIIQLEEQRKAQERLQY